MQEHKIKNSTHTVNAYNNSSALKSEENKLILLLVLNTIQFCIAVFFFFQFLHPFQDARLHFKEFWWNPFKSGLFGHARSAANDVNFIKNSSEKIPSWTVATSGSFPLIVSSQLDVCVQLINPLSLIDVYVTVSKMWTYHKLLNFQIDV